MNTTLALARELGMEASELVCALQGGCTAASLFGLGWLKGAKCLIGMDCVCSWCRQCLLSWLGGSAAPALAVVAPRHMVAGSIILPQELLSS